MAISDIISALDTQILAIINDPDGISDYKIGDKTVNRSKKLDYLLKTRETYQKFANSEPYENVQQIALEYDEFGQDTSEYHGEDLA